METISAQKKAQLDEVADLMLNIYNTLVRMRYLKPHWIHRGPHHIDHLLPLCQSLRIDPEIIYLYSVLPYVNTGGVKGVDFFQGGYFADFRDKSDVEDGRDPFYERCDDDDQGGMASYMTPLSLLGNHQSVIIYCSRTHWIWIYDQQSPGSMDHAVHHNIECADGYDYSAANGRDASAVLNDIVKWYHDLRETPGGGEESGNDWEHETVVELYRKHGWPGPNFDGDAFEVDHVRSIAHRALTWSANEPLRKLEESQSKPNDWAYRAVEDALKKIKKAKKVDEEWMARWDLFEAEQAVANCERQAREARADAARYCPEGLVLRPEEELLLEAKYLQRDHEYKLQEIHTLRTQLAESRANSRGDEDHHLDLKLRHCQEEGALIRRAVTTVMPEAERLYPGQTITTANGLRIMNESTKETRIEETNAVIESEHERMRHMKAWSEQIPKKAKKATAASQAAIKQCEKSIESLVDMVDRINKFG